MRICDVIRKKRDGGKLTEEEIRFFVDGYTRGEIPDYQAAALCMAIFLRGMDDEETAHLTFAVRDSGEKPDASAIRGIRADKHSTGGVGDKTSLVVCPIVASCGVTVAKISGRGLGHTGGTVDKLDSIPGFRTELSETDFLRIANEIGLAIVGQSRDLAPADKKLYALRDVTATVDSIPLIAASIMGKKLAAGDDVIVLDVKTGSGAFMKTRESARLLAETMVSIGKRAGKTISALITDMDAPLGRAIGNAIEVNEATETLRFPRESDFLAVCLALSEEILFLAGKGTREACGQMAQDALTSGRAYDTYRAFVAAQGGDVGALENGLPLAPLCRDVLAWETGYVICANAEAYGEAALLLGAGRSTMADEIDAGAGLYLWKKHGEYAEKGERIATLYASDATRFAEAERRMLSGTGIRRDKPAFREPVLSKID